MDALDGMQAKNSTWSPVSIVQGPTEPGSYHDVMAPIREFFEKHDPGVNLGASACVGQGLYIAENLCVQGDLAPSQFW